MLLALSTISGAVVQPALLDPLSLVNNKALQATTLLPYKSPAENNGLSTATLALGWFWHPEAALAALPGVVKTSVGYCGGSMASPSYRKVCNDRDFSDYAETIRVEFDAAKLPYDDLLDSFFNAHDATARGKSRQYASVVFAHDAAQRASAEAAVARRPAVHTTIEDGGDYWAAEAYHQKWILQRKRGLFMKLGLTDVDELQAAPASVLNAYAAGRLRSDLAAARLAECGVADDVLVSLGLLASFQAEIEDAFDGA